MSGAAPAKFRFDLDLGHRAERNTVVTESGLATLLANARAEGRSEGVAEGERNATVRAAQQIATSAQKLADHAAAMSASLDDSRRATLSDAISLAVEVGKKLAHHLVAKYPAEEIEALIAECLASLDSVPHLVVRCHPEVADDVREIAEARIATSGFTGRLVVLGDPEFSPGDARLEWVDGGIARDLNELHGEIDKRIAQYLAASQGGREDTGGPAQ